MYLYLGTRVLMSALFCEILKVGFFLVTFWFIIFFFVPSLSVKRCRRRMLLSRVFFLSYAFHVQVVLFSLL